MGTLTEVIGNSVSYYIKYFRNEKQNPFSIENFNDTYNIYYILLNKTLLFLKNESPFCSILDTDS